MKAKDDRGRTVRLERLPIAAVREVDRPPLCVDPRQLERSSLAERKSFRWWMLVNLILFAAFLFAFWPAGRLRGVSSLRCSNDRQRVAAGAQHRAHSSHSSHAGPADLPMLRPRP